MLVAELKWLMVKLPDGDPDRKRIETAYLDEIEQAGSDGETIDLFSVDKFRLPELLFSLGCPAFREDRRVPFPSGALQNMPLPLNAAEKQTLDRLEGNGSSTHFITTAPLHDRLTEKYEPGPMFDLAAARTFQQRPEGRGTRLEDISWVTLAYREDADQRKEALQKIAEQRLVARKNAERDLDTKFPHALQLCTKGQLDRLELWYHSDEEAIIQLPSGLSFSKAKAQGLRGIRPVISSSITHGFVALLRNYVERHDRQDQIAVMDAEPLTSADKSTGWATNFFGHGVSCMTFDKFDAILVPIQTGRHFSLILVENKGNQSRVVVYNPDAPMEMSAQNRIAKMWLGELTDRPVTVELAPGPAMEGLEVCGLLVCYYAALYVARESVATLDFVDEKCWSAVAEWVVTALLDGLTDEMMGRLRLPSATPRLNESLG